jgi:hypothetical protein
VLTRIPCRSLMAPGPDSDGKTGPAPRRPGATGLRTWLRLAIAASVVVPILLAPPAFAAEDGSPATQGGRAHLPELSYIDTRQPPEDILALPRTRWVVLSAVARAGDHPGGLSLVDRRTAKETPLWPAANFRYAYDPTAFPGCDGPPDETLPKTHGINAVKTGPGTFDLYVVYHGSRESVEVFSLDVHGNHPTASWRGCVKSPELTSGNGVVGLPDGGIAITHFADPRTDTLTQLFSGAPTGYLLTWHRDSGWRKVPGSDMVGPNGIEVSPDGATLFAAETTKNRIMSIPTLGGQPTEVARVPLSPDNLRWTDAGTLLTTGNKFEPVTEAVLRACLRQGVGCPLGFDVVEVDPAAGTSETVFSTETADYRYPTVAAPVGREIWVGGNVFAKIGVVSGLHRDHHTRSGHD